METVTARWHPISRVVFGPPIALAEKTGSETKESFLKEVREVLCALQHT